MLADFDITSRADGEENLVDYDIWYTSTNDVALDFI